MRPNDIINKSDQRSINKAHKQSLKAKIYKVEDNKIIYTVNSSEGDKQYFVAILLLSLSGNRLRSLKAALSGDIKISCTCPAFLYMGYKYITYKKQVGINKETRAPDKTNPERKGMACKHIIAALEQMKSDYSAIYNMIKSQAPKDRSMTNVKNTDSTVLTEEDIEIISKVKDECDKLYSDYIAYTNDADSKVDFMSSDYYHDTNPAKLLLGLSKPAIQNIKNTFIGKFKSLPDILKLIDQKKNGFNIMVKSDTDTLIKKINSYIGSKTESLINDIILNLLLD